MLLPHDFVLLPEQRAARIQICAKCGLCGLQNGVMIDTLEAPAVLGEYVLLSGHVPQADVRPFSIR